MTHPLAWSLKDLAAVPRNGLTVATTFSCGGGSSMGYRLAGCDVIAANDIDPVMARHYRANLHPKHYFLMPIREMLSAKLPPEMFNLDILDGSPPCSTFSTTGSREKSWGKDKHFREGQAKQVLSDLFFDFLDVAAHLRPRAIIAENVKGLILGNAKGYVRLIFARLKEMGYRPQLFLVNAADCGVPQRRERVFFCALREDVKRPSLVLVPRERWVTCAAACSDLQKLSDEEIHDTKAAPMAGALWGNWMPGEGLDDAQRRAGRVKLSSFSQSRADGNRPVATLTSSLHAIYHWDNCRTLTYREFKRLGSFPDDYQAETPQIGKYMVGMSVPPRMTQAVARAVADQWLLT